MRFSRQNSLRVQVLRARNGPDGITCDRCNWREADLRKCFVYSTPDLPKTAAHAAVLCSTCHSQKSRRKFFENHPDAGPGWGKIRAAERLALGLPKRKAGRRLTQEILVDPARIDDYR